MHARGGAAEWRGVAPRVWLLDMSGPVPMPAQTSPPCLTGLSQTESIVDLAVALARVDSSPVAVGQPDVPGVRGDG